MSGYRQSSYEAFNALSLRGALTLLLVIGVLIGLQLLANHFGVSRWLSALVQLLWVALGAKLIRDAYRSLKTGEPLEEALVGPRYAEERFRTPSPRAVAIMHLVLGVLLILMAADRIFQILVE